MRERMQAMRRLLANEIRARSNAVDAGFLTRQREMFSFTGLERDAVTSMRERDGICLVESGRMCVAGLTKANATRVAGSLARELVVVA